MTKTAFQFPDNVATIEKSASVQDGVSRSRHALLNGDTSNYDWDSGYTCHQLNSGSICVQLGQPYAIESMKLLLWDCDDPRYSYFIEVSNNKTDWQRVWDRSNSPCQSWQTISFPRRPVVFIRIVGTHNTANEVFHCVHFECPSTTKIENADNFDNTEESFEEVEEDEEENDEEMMMAAAALPTTNNYENASQNSQNSQQSSPISVGHFALGASACSMAKNNVQQFPSGTDRSNSPILNQNPVAGPSRSYEQSPAPSVDEASSALAHLLEIDESNPQAGPPQARSNSSAGASAGGSRRVYQHALSVRVPPNNQNNSGAIPRRKRQQNNVEES